MNPNENNKEAQDIQQDTKEGIEINATIEIYRVKKKNIFIPLLVSVVLCSTALAIGYIDTRPTTHAVEKNAPKTATHPITIPTAPFDPQKNYTTIELSDIQDYVAFYDETYMDTLIRYLGEKHEKLDETRFKEIRDELRKSVDSVGLGVSEEFIDGQATNYAYSEILRLATGNLSFTLIDEEVEMGEKIYKSYYVILNDDVDKSVLKKVRKVLSEEDTPKAIEKRLKAENLWDKVSVEEGYNTVAYMGDSFQKIITVDVGEIIEDNTLRYVAKLLAVETVSRETLLEMYLEYYSYGSYEEALNIYMEMLQTPYRLSADLRASLDKPTEAYEQYIATVQKGVK